MVWIGNNQRISIIKNRFRLLECHAMLGGIAGSLLSIPFEEKFTHSSIAIHCIANKARKFSLKFGLSSDSLLDCWVGSGCRVERRAMLCVAACGDRKHGRRQAENSPLHRRHGSIGRRGPIRPLGNLVDVGLDGFHDIWVSGAPKKPNRLEHRALQHLRPRSFRLGGRNTGKTAGYRPIH